MIYINEDTTTVTFPKAVGNDIDTLTIENQTTHKVITISTTSYTVDMTDYISEFEVGQYDYRLTGDGTVYMSGILQFGDYTATAQQYQVSETIKQYDA